MTNWLGRSWYPRQESNLYLEFRKPSFYPLNYGDAESSESAWIGIDVEGCVDRPRWQVLVLVGGFWIGGVLQGVDFEKKKVFTWAPRGGYLRVSRFVGEPSIHLDLESLYTSMKRIFLFWAAMVMLSTGASAAWQRASGSGQRELELSIGSIEGTKIESSENIGRVSALLSDRVTEDATLAKGSSQAVVNLGRQAIIDRVSFYNAGGEGRVAISASVDKQKWDALGQLVFSPADVHVVVPFAAIQGKFVKVEYDVTRETGVKHFEVYGSMVSGSTDRLTGKVANQATAVSGARVIYINPTPSNGSDDSVRYGSFSFPESKDKYRTVIYDLGRPKVLNEFGSVHSPRPVRFEVFVFTELPEKEDWKGRRSFDPAAFDEAEPVASFEDKEGKGFVKCRPIEAVTAQYVALRWEPDFNPPAFVVSGVDLIGPFFEIGREGGKGANAEVLPDQERRGGQQIIGGGMPGGGFYGPFAPNSLGGAGAGGLPITGGGTAGGGPSGGGGGGGGGGVIVIPPVSPR